MKQLLQDFERFYILFENCAYCQGCLPTLLRRKKYRDHFQLLPLTTMGHPGYGHPDFNFDINKNFLCHPAGSTTKEKTIDIINQIKCNTWWSQIK